jgi:glycosyltransferase involved in cell wall biosynthesis
MERRPRVLLVAEMCNPEWVSVPLVGWSHARALAEVADTHLVTHSRNREAILRAGLVEGRDFTAIDTGMDKPMARVLGWLGVPMGSNKGWTALAALSTFSYYRFELLLWSLFRARLEAREFDLVHRLTPLSPATPSLLARRCARLGVPFVLGPLNGGLPWPRGFDKLRLKEREWLSYVRGAHRLLPGYRSTRDSAAAILVGSQATRAELKPRWQSKAVYLPENAIDPERFGRSSEALPPPPLRIAFVGRLVPYKGADMLLEAVTPLARRGAATVDIIGDGPEKEALQALVDRSCIGRAVSFAGWIPHREVQQRMAQAHVLGFPSVREFGGGVVAEAMALGLVPIVADFGGPGELVTRDSAFLLPLGRRDEMVRALRAALEQLAARPEVLPGMAERARRRALTLFTWHAKARQVSEVYGWVLGRRPKPDFGMPLGVTASAPAVS